jgi:DNA helicase-2/ATP-dependent DNA helicase PcrA
MRCYTIQQNNSEPGIYITWNGNHTAGIEIGSNLLVEASGLLYENIIENQINKIDRISIQKKQDNWFLVKEQNKDQEEILIFIREKLFNVDNTTLIIKTKKDKKAPCPNRVKTINVTGTNRCPLCDVDLGVPIDDYPGNCKYLHPDNGIAYDYEKKNSSNFYASSKHFEIARGIHKIDVIDDEKDTVTIFEWLGKLSRGITYELNITGSSDIIYLHWSGKELDYWRNPKEGTTPIQITNKKNDILIEDPKFLEPSQDIIFTDEQKLVVHHDYGPALVFAVAGSGKTTCLVYRIERLVREGLFPPEKILVSSFNKMAVEEIHSKLRRWSCCQPVDVRTLHSLGLSILKKARLQKNIPLSYSYEDPEALKKKIVFEAIKIARGKNVYYGDILDNLDIDDFLSYVEKCKTNIDYADLNEANLPNQGLQQATQAKAPQNLPWYLDLYRLYEEVRKTNNWITYDDMLLEGWESLISYPEILNFFRQKYSCVLIDEFQDINKVQHAILDLLIDEHRNYMAIGDDDQTIYQWRGADPNYIIEFEKRYQAKKYILSLNFRSTATQVLLANEVIQHNKIRSKKTLHLYRTEKGLSQIIPAQNPQSMVNEIVDFFHKKFNEGLLSEDIVILVRLYSQTPIIESAFIKNDIDYQIIGNVPFYQRNEIRLFLDYLRIGLYELFISEKRNFEIDNAWNAWMNIYHQPPRYIKRKVARRIFEQVKEKQDTFSNTLKYHAPFTGNSREKVLNLAEHLEWLASNINNDEPSILLKNLDQKMKISQYLMNRYSRLEKKEEIQDEVRNFFDYCRDFKNVHELLEHFDTLAESQNIHKNSSRRVTIMSIHQAKGKEWDYVLIPHVNHGIIPFTGNEIFEEERRLFYVAVTRAKKFLNIYTIDSKKPSQFLSETDAEKLLQSFYRTESILSSDIQKASFEDLLTLLTHHQIKLYQKILAPWWNSLPTDWEKLFKRLTRLLTYLERIPLNMNISIPNIKRNLWFEIPQGQLYPEEIDIQEFPGIEKHINQEIQQKIKHCFLSEEWPPKKKVIHSNFGEGEVTMTYKGKTGNCYLDIYFPTHGQKTFQYPPPKGLFKKVDIN